MSTKKVKAKHDFEHQGKKHAKGTTIELPEHEANNLLQQGHVEEETPASPTGGTASQTSQTQK